MVAGVDDQWGRAPSCTEIQVGGNKKAQKMRRWSKTLTHAIVYPTRPTTDPW